MPDPCSLSHASRFPPSILAEWLGQSVFDTPAHPDPCEDAISVDTGFFSPLDNRLRAALVGQEMIAAAVEGLFRGSSPAAIPGGIRPIVVDAVNAVLRGGTRTHICKEGFKGVRPFRADRDATPAISLERVTVGVQAATFQTRPDIVFRRGTHPMPQCGVLREVDTERLPCLTVETAARTDVTLLQIAGTGDVLIPAVTEAAPLSPFPWSFVGE